MTHPLRLTPLPDHEWTDKFPAAASDPNEPMVQDKIGRVLDIAGTRGVVDVDYLSRQFVALGGGSDEIARNVISEGPVGISARIHRGPRDPVQSGQTQPIVQ